MQIATVPRSPSSSPMAENTKSVDALGIFCGLPSPSPVPWKPPDPERVQRLHDLVAVVCATDHGSIQICTRSCTWPNSWYATNAPARNMPSADDEVRRSARSRCRASPRTPRRTAATTRGPSGAPSRGSRRPTRAAAARGASGRGAAARPMRRRARLRAARACRRGTRRRRRPAAPWPPRPAGSSAARRAPRAGRR